MVNDGSSYWWFLAQHVVETLVNDSIISHWEQARGEGVTEDCKNLIEYIRLFKPKPLTLSEIIDLENFYIENKLLTHKQARFCHCYDRYRNKSKAYHIVYNCSFESANTNVHRLFKNPNICLFIRALNQRTWFLASRFITFHKEAKRLNLSYQDRTEGDEELNQDLFDIG